MVVETEKQTHRFEAEVSQLLNLVVNSLYSNKEIFLRELISNASDAIEKCRFLSLTDNSILGDDSEYKIWIKRDKQAGTLTISDNGVGMNREDVIEHLGTIARSGTKEFLSQLSGNEASDSQMIGQFGVGFYSAFIVADKVTVLSRKAGENADQAVRWESDGIGDYQVENISKQARGTDIILHLKADQKEYLEEWQVRSIVTKYSDHISVPIQMEVESFLESEKDEAGNPKDEEPKTETKLETINQAKALWTRHKNDITEDQYNEFYKHISHDYENPLTWSLNRVEGKSEYISLLYVPAHAPFDLWNRETPRGLKLYVQRVFILENADQFLPLYLRFVKGVIDSNDLPLNVSRELLQDDKKVDAMKAAITKRVLSMLEKLSEDKEKYEKFWKVFGSVIKEGPVEDYSNREKIAKLLRFASTHQESPEENVSLDDYISRMPEEQEKIYFVIADSFNAAKNSPHLEIFRKKGYEVLLLSDRIDEWLMSHLNEYEGKKFQSVNTGDLEIEETETEKEAHKQQAEDFSSVLKQMKTALGERVKEVKITHRLTESPACIVAAEGEMSGHMQRILEAAGQAAPSIAPILEINPEHALVCRLKDIQDDAKFNEWSAMLLEQAILSEGGNLDDPAAFVKRVNKLLTEQ